MKTGSLFCNGVLLCFALLASAADQGGAQSAAKASGNADAKSTGEDVKKAAGAKPTDKGAKADAKADAKTGTTSGKPQPDPAAEVAWRAFISKCEAKYYDPKVTSPGTCANLSGVLCSRKDVKCAAADKTEFLDASGKVIATGDHKTEKIA